jgi:hypothetical protein
MLRSIILHNKFCIDIYHADPAFPTPLEEPMNQNSRKGEDTLPIYNLNVRCKAPSFLISYFLFLIEIEGLKD